MNTTQHGDSDYMTVGEIAAKAGVTVRTVQYYDQKGLLMPSAKGSRNLRLYTSMDLNRLHRILCFKFLGLSLDEIRERIDQDESAEIEQQIVEALQERIIKEEQVISEGMKRYAMLKDLQNYTDNHAVASWGSYAELIGYLQEKWHLIWELNRAYEDGRQLDQEMGSDAELKEFYRLSAQTIRLMREGASPQSEEAKEIVTQYFSLRNRDSGSGTATGDIEKEALLQVDPLIMATDAIDYTRVWNEIKEFLSAAAKNYRNSGRNSEAVKPEGRP